MSRLLTVYAACLAMLPATETGAQEPASQPTAQAPEGFRRLTVLGLLPMPEGDVVVLSNSEETLYVPIVIGPAQAFAISMRLEGQGFERPLTHDLLDQVINQLGAELIEVRIDSLQSNAFVATLRLRQGDRVIMVDSRASDSIVMALGNDTPIYVSEQVIRETALHFGPGSLTLPDPAPTDL
jgi:bifunctional DNase/RNase